MLRSAKWNPVVRAATFSFVALVGALSTAWAQPSGPAAPVVVTAVVEQEVTIGQKFLGTVMPMRRSVVGSAVAGRVLTLYVDEGDEVTMSSAEDAADSDDGPETSGPPLAQLRVKTIGIQIAAARSELAARREELAKLKQSLPQQIKQATARRQAAEALMQYAETKFRRTKSLFEQSTTTQDELDAAFSSLVSTQQAFDAAQSELDELVETDETQIAQAASRLQAQQDEVDLLEDIKAKYTIRAPFDGYVVAKHTEVGAWISEGDPVFEIVELDPVEININVPEAYIAKLQEGMEAAQRDGMLLTANVYVPAIATQRFEGEVTRIVPQADPRTRAFPVKVRVKNPRSTVGHLLKAGMLAEVVLAVGTEQRALLVPKDALVLGGRAPAVYIATTDKASNKTTVQPVSVQTGAAFGSFIEVRGQLKAGDRVVVLGNERLRPGQEVTIQARGIINK